MNKIFYNLIKKYKIFFNIVKTEPPQKKVVTEEVLELRKKVKDYYNQLRYWKTKAQNLTNVNKHLKDAFKKIEDQKKEIIDLRKQIKILNNQNVDQKQKIQVQNKKAELKTTHKNWINLLLDSSYRECCNLLIKKYGAIKQSYFSTPECKSKRNSIRRGKEGLYIHHIDEDKDILLSTPVHAKINPWEWQQGNRLVYCNLLEHLTLHIKIVEYPKRGKLNWTKKSSVFYMKKNK